ncbi:MAG: Crp/Fnr family transcriptional regulator [Candidatus Obscuribacterales bacterium]|nr:Crp/Fnr family transcriptional regulator [Candidatus Obscuribacterales bacterium]
MSSPRKFSALQQSELFDSLTPTEMARLMSQVEPLDLPKHHSLFVPGSPCTAIYFIEAGSLRLTKPSPDGRSFVILALLGPGELLGDAAWQCGTHDCSADTLEESRVYQISCDVLEGFVKENPNFALRLVQVVGMRLKQAQDRIEDLVFRQVPSRVAKLLMNLAENHGKMTPSGIVLDVPLTHQEIADFVGSSRVTVTQVLNRFRSRNWVGIKSKKVTIRNPAALEELAVSDEYPRTRRKENGHADTEEAYDDFGDEHNTDEGNPAELAV